MGDHYLNLIEEAKVALAGPSHKARAEAIGQVWEYYQGRRLGKHGEKPLMAELFGLQSHTTQALAILRKLTDACSGPVYKLLDDGEMNPGRAEQLLRDAKAQSKTSGVDLEVAIGALVREYMSRPVTSFKGGYNVRQKPITSIPRLHDLKHKAKVTKKTTSRADPDGNRVFWSKLREDIARFISPKLEGVDPIIGEKLWRDFELGLKGYLDEFGVKVSRALSSEKELAGGTKMISHSSVQNACKVLNITAPRPGKPVDLALAKKQKKRMVVLYHPDKGNPATRPMYEQVIEAFIVIEQYAEQFSAPNS